jgi:hypothetical protein
MSGLKKIRKKNDFSSDALMEGSERSESRS